MIHRFVRACVRAGGRATAGKGRRRGDNLAGYCRGDPSLGMGVCISRPKAEGEVTDARVLCTEDTHRYTQIHPCTHAKPTFTTSTTAIVVVGAILYREKHTVNPRTYFEGGKLHTPLTHPPSPPHVPSRQRPSLRSRPAAPPVPSPPTLEGVLVYHTPKTLPIPVLPRQPALGEMHARRLASPHAFSACWDG